MRTPDETGSDPKLWCVYNFKGGVMKTTTVINLAISLRTVRHPAAPDSSTTVLIVDADPQCNLTAFFEREVRDIEDDTSDDEVSEYEASDEAFEGRVACDSIEKDAEPMDPGSLGVTEHDIFAGLQPVLEQRAGHLGCYDDKTLKKVSPAAAITW